MLAYGKVVEFNGGRGRAVVLITTGEYRQTTAVVHHSGACPTPGWHLINKDTIAVDVQLGWGGGIVRVCQAIP